MSFTARELIDEDEFYDDDWSDGDLTSSQEALVVTAPRSTTIGEAAKKAPKAKKKVNHPDDDEDDADDAAAAAAVAREQEEFARIATVCAELQRAELDRLPSGRATVLESDGGGARQLTITGELYSLRVFYGPLYPHREHPSVHLESTLPRLEQSFRRAVKAVSSQRVQQTLIVELVEALDDVVRLEREVAPAIEPTALLRLVDDSVPPLEFLGSGATVTTLAMAPCPCECTGETVVLVGTKIFCIGGVPLSGTIRDMQMVRIFDLASRKWTAHEWKFNATLLNRCGVRVGHKIYVFGGKTWASHSVDEPPIISVLDTRDFSWSTLPGIRPTSLSFNTATRVGDEVWLVGGAVTDKYEIHRVPNKRFVFVFDLKRQEFRTWNTDRGPEANLVVARPERFESLPAIREHTATRVGRFIFVHGGVVDGISLSSQSFVIDTVDLCCLEVVVATQPKARAGHAAARINDRAIAFVGGRTFADHLLHDIDLFDLCDKTWSVRKAPLFLGRIGGALLASNEGALLCIGGYVQTTKTIRERSRYSRLVAERVVTRAQVLDLGVPRLAPPSQLPAFLLKTLQSGNLSDVAMRNEQHRLHRVLLQARCPHLLELIESKQRVDAFDDDALRVLFRHLYGGEPVDGKLRGEFASILRLPYLVQDDDAAPTVQASLGALFDDDALRCKHADVTFVAGEETFRVHRLFVSRAPHFARALDAGMREAQTGTIRVDDVAPATVRALLRFLYSDELVCDAEHAVEMLALADRCQLDDLKKHAETLIESSYDFGELQNVLELLDVAHRYGTAHLQHVALSMLVHDFDQRTVMDVMADANVSEAVARMVRMAQW
jgi:hypothetical protein